MKIVVNKEKCIGCGLCVSLAEKTFKLSEEGKAMASLSKDPLEKIKEAVSSCPVEAISIKE